MDRVPESYVKNNTPVRLISSTDLKCLQVWAVMCLLYLIWIISFKTHYWCLKADLPFDEMYNVVSSIGYALSLLVMWFKRQPLSNVVTDLTRFLRQRNQVFTAVKVKLRRSLYCSFLVGVFLTFVWVTMLITTKNSEPIKKYMKIYFFLPDNDALRYFLFVLLTGLYFLTFLSFRIVVSVVLFACVCTLTNQSLTCLIASVTSIRNDNFAFDELYRVVDDFETISSCVDRFNDAMSGVTLMWYAGAMITCCLRITHSIIEFSSDQTFKVWNVPVYFQEVGILVALIVVASRVTDKMAAFDACLVGLRGKAAREGKVADLSLLSQQIKSLTSKSGLKIANTFVINKNLLISFIGVSVTYAVVYLQLNPRALSAIYGIKQNSSSASIFD